jgi:multiple RNA-binding domain-containing protein 1
MKPRTGKGKAWSNEDPSPITAKARAMHQRQQQQQTETTTMDVDEVSPKTDNDTPPEGMSDLEWMRRRMRKAVLDEDTEKAFEQSDDDEGPVASTSKLAVRIFFLSPIL